eukprot:891-Eustigmatos_ZCMA.PRE.1
MSHRAGRTPSVCVRSACTLLASVAAVSRASRGTRSRCASRALAAPPAMQVSQPRCMRDLDI